MAVFGIASAAPSGPPDAVTVPDILRSLTATGVDVLYSSDLVAPGLEVAAPLSGSDPMSRAVEALAMHGLMLRKIANGRYIVTRAPGAGPATAAASTSPAAAPAIPLEEISVFASRYAFGDTALSEPYSMTGSSVAQSPGSSDDALRALRTAPGIATNVSSQPYVRGAFLNDVLVQFDGVALTDPFHFKKFQSVISALDPSAIDRMNVYTGGFPVEFGTRSAAVIDLAPRTIESGSEYQVSASRETAELSTVGRAERWPVEWLLTLRHSTDGELLQPVDATFGSPAFYDSVGRVRWQASASSALTLGWLLLDDQAHVGGEPSEEQSRAEFRDLNVWVAWDWNAAGAIQGRTSVATNTEHQERDGTLNLPGIATGQLSDQRAVSGVTLRSNWLFLPTSSISISAGAEAAQQNAQLNFIRNETFSSTVVDAFGTPPAAAIVSNQEPGSSTQSVYASLRWRWQSFEAEAGGRIDRQDYRSYGAHVQGSPRFNARYDPAESWHVYSSWGEFTQAQRPDEWRSEENQQAPDPATRATHLIGGIAHDGADAVQWRLEAYRNHWTSLSPYFDNSLDSVSLVAELEPDRVRIAPADAETAGVELSARRSFGANFDGWSTYAVSRTTDDLKGVDVSRSWDQTHAASMGMAWRHLQNSASMVLAWHSGWPSTPVALLTAIPATSPGFLVGARNSARWGDYFTADVRVARAMSFAQGDLSVWIDATNLTNRTNECCTQFGSTDLPQAQPLLQTVHWRPREINVGFSWRIRRK
ncbi:MAG: TonB-dependent receptor plug domain-containing protein [Steroidobacterales bacterium]